MLTRGVRRAGGYAAVLLVALLLNFALPRVAPGDPVDYLLPPQTAGAVTAEQRQRALSNFGLDAPLPVQLQQYFVNLGQGDLGLSVRYARPVTEILGERVGWTALLVGGALVLSTLVGVLLGFASAWRRGTATDTATLTAVMVIDAMPPFFTGLLLIFVFSVQLDLLPVFGALPASGATGLSFAGDVLERLVLPLVTLTLGYLGTVYLVARASLIGELQEDYVLMARAKGLDERGVRRHAQRNALIPVTTVTLVGLGTLVGGAAVVETVFSYPGLGLLIYDAVLTRDYPLLQGAFLLLAAGVLLANFIADLLYPLLDPRVRRTGAQVG